MRLGSYACDLTPGSLAHRVYGVEPDPGAAPAPLRVQLPVRANARGARPADLRPLTGRQVRRDRRTARPPVVPGRSVPSRSSSRSRRGRIRCLRASSRRRIGTRARTCAPRRRHSHRAEAGRQRGKAGRRDRPFGARLRPTGPSRPSSPSRPRIMKPVNPVTIGEIAIGGGRPLVLMAGPCVIESEAHATELAGRLVASDAPARHPVHLQGVLRQGQPHVGHLVPRTRASTKDCASSRRSSHATTCRS